MALAVCLVLICQCVTIFYYVENFVTIPQNWVGRIRTICPKVKKVDFLHYQGPAFAGYSFVVPLAYFWNAFARSDFGRQFYPRVSHLSDKRGVCELATRLLVCLLFDHLTSKALPLWIYSTKDLDIHQDFWVKRFGAVFMFTLVALSPCDNYLKLLFRSPDLAKVTSETSQM